MDGPNLTCQDEVRRQRVRQAELNGIDFLEVSDDQRILTLVFLGKAPADLTTANIRIDGGTVITNIRATAVEICPEAEPDYDDCVKVTVDRPGDFSTYRLCLVKADARGRPGREPLDGFDPRYACIDFSFKANCPNGLDCLPDNTCPPVPAVEPEINYLAKDYASFRRLILDRMALTLPDWKERHIPDQNIALVELLAYTGDYLSYYQDAVATEAYLDTARRRVSVRRHLRLIDYFLHEGCNARAWVCIETGAELTLRKNDFYFITGYPSGTGSEPPYLSHAEAHKLPAGSFETFEPLIAADTPLWPAHNAISFWTWGDRQCCLPAGTTHATLRDGWVDGGSGEPGPDKPPYPKPGYPDKENPALGPGEKDEAAVLETYRRPRPKPPAERPRLLRLQAGDVLIFEEILGPKTGLPADANHSNRQAVRLIKVTPGIDALCNQPVLEIEWAVEDALHFPLCISSLGGEGCELLSPVSVARGNVILVDHGRSLTRPGDPIEEWEVPGDLLDSDGCDALGRPRPVRRRHLPFNPVLDSAPVTHRAAFPNRKQAAALQARRLEEIIPRLIDRIEWLWRQAANGHALAPEQLDELGVIFGREALIKVDLLWIGRRPRRIPDAHKQAAALAGLLARYPRYLTVNLRRLQTLITRADAGALLGALEIAEIAEMFGAVYAAGLSADNPIYSGPARDALQQDPLQCVAEVCLVPGGADWSDAAGSGRCDAPNAWLPVRDLLYSGPEDQQFVVEVDDDGQASLRFGDGELGRLPTPGSCLRGRYRVGNGKAGNVGAEVISRIILVATQEEAILRVRNPLPAEGGLDPQSSAEAKLIAPLAMRHDIQRAITAADYALLAEKTPGVQRAAAYMSWNGSWYEVRVALDSFGDPPPDERLLAAVLESLHRYRRIGHDLAVIPARYVPLLIGLCVRVKPEYLRAHVRRALLEQFGAGVLPSGGLGLFHPDNLTFGAGIYLSRLVTAALSTAGVESAQVTKLERLFTGPQGELDAGALKTGPIEIPRMDNDRNRPENGNLILEIGGGR